MTANITITIEELKEEAKIKGREEGKLEGRIEGKIEGKNEAKIEVAKALLDVLDDETIAMKTKVSLETIRKMRQESCIEG